MTACLFCQIAQKKLNSALLYEDELAVAFADINPQAPTHFLIIPKEHIASINALTPEHNALVGHLYQVAQHLAKEQGFAEDGYRVCMNCNSHGGQTVFHIHLHVLAGRQMHWPPG